MSDDNNTNVIEDTNTDTDQEQKTWDKDRQFRDELKAGSLREGELTGENTRLAAEIERLKTASENTNLIETENLTPDDDSYDSVLKRVATLESSLNTVSTENKNLRQTVDDVRTSANNTAGAQIISDLAKAQEKRLGRNDLTNDVLAKVNKTYQEKNIANWPATERSEWIGQQIELEFTQQNAAKPKPTAPNKPDVNVGGPGSGPPTSEIKEGSMKEVGEQIRKLYENST